MHEFSVENEYARITHCAIMILVLLETHYWRINTTMEVMPSEIKTTAEHVLGKRITPI